MKREIYVSVDIETDGGIPGPHSMLSLGSAAFELSDEDPRGFRCIDTFSCNLLPLEGASPDASTAAWWATQPEAWTAIQENRLPPAKAMQVYAGWLNRLPGKPVLVGYPAVFDGGFIYWYLTRFTGSSPLSFSGIDVKTYAMAMLRTDYGSCGVKGMPARWAGSFKNTHVAKEDALEQGEVFCRMLVENMRGLVEAG